jgi:hypothetical protein
MGDDGVGEFPIPLTYIVLQQFDDVGDKHIIFETQQFDGGSRNPRLQHLELDLVLHIDHTIKLNRKVHLLSQFAILVAESTVLFQTHTLHTMCKKREVKRERERSRERGQEREVKREQRHTHTEREGMHA